VPVIASGGAGIPSHLVDVFNKGKADAGLVASMVHYGTYTIPSIKAEISAAGIPMRSLA
jgi:cyclase